MSGPAQIVIVGAGPAGLATALFLQHAAPALAERVVVLERARFPRDKPCAGGLGGRADRLLASIGVVVDVPSVPLDRLAYAAAGRRVIVKEPGFGRVVQRVEYDAELAREARRRGVRLREGVAVTGVRLGARGIRLDTSEGPLDAAVVVGADGVGSVVRRALGLGRGSTRAQVVEVETPHVSGDLERDAVLFSTDDRTLPGYYWEFPTLSGGEARMCRGVYALTHAGAGASAGPTATRSPDPESFLARELERRGLDLRHCTRKRFAERGFEPGAAVSRPRALLVGEAAGIDAVTGEGIAQALQYGATAGRYLTAKWTEGDLRFEDWADALRGSSVGRDLAVRHLGLAPFYGRWRPAVEAFLLDNPGFFEVGLQHFGGKHRSGRKLVSAAAHALWHTAKTLGSLREAPREATPHRQEPT